jgi:uncharacterized protein DUF4157
MATAARVFQAPTPAPPPKIVAPEIPRPRSTRTPDAVSRRLAPAVRMGTAASAVDNQPMSTAAGGQPLAPAVRMAIEDSYQVDLGGVRVHSGPSAQQAAGDPSARAFTHGSNIVLGPGESPTDLMLMAHEAAHVVQQQSAPVIQRYTLGGDSYEHEAHQASAAVARGETFHIQQRTSPRTQRLGLSDIRDYIADKANIIPGFRMFTIVIGVNPINGAEADRSPGNILRAIIEFIPFGGLITQALDNYGIFDKIGNWVAQQLKSLGMVGSAIAQAVSDFIHSLGVSDFLHPGDTWERAKAIFTGPIDQLINFAKGLFDGIVQFIKDAILKPLAALAEGTPGWALLTAVLGKNPITGEAVPQTAENLIGPFMTLIGQEEIWENMKKANALARCWAWFKGALAGLLSFVEQIPELFMSTLRSLEIMDIVVLPRAFIKVGKAFGGFLVKFMSWAGDTIWDLLKIIFEVVAPGAMPYLQKVGGAIKKIFKDPISFVGNLVKAGKLGFQNFASNIGTHLKKAFLEWLTGSLPGIYIPKALNLKEFALLALSVLAITWANIRQKLVKATSENIVKGLETGFAIVKKLVTEGPAAAWEEIKSQLTNLKDMVMEGIMNFIIETVVKKAVAKVLSLLVPGGAFIQAIISIYDTVMVFIAKLKKIIQVAMAFLDSMMAIANGVIGAAAAKVESTLAGLLVLAISFLAGFLGLNKIADKVMDIINTKVRAPVDKAIDFVINWIVTTAKNLFKALFGKKDAKPDDKGGPNIKLSAPADMHGEGHTIFTEVRAGKLYVEMASSQRTELLGLTARAMSETTNKTAVGRLQTVYSKLKAAEDKVTFLISDRQKDAEALAEADKMTQDSANQLKSIGVEFGIPSLTVIPHKSGFVEATVTGYFIKSAFAAKIRDLFYPSSYEPATRQWKRDFLKNNTDPNNSKNFIDYAGRSEPKTTATIDHQPRVVEHWDSSGKLTPQDARAIWYSDHASGHLRVIAKKYNSSDGAEARNMGLRYKPDKIGKGFLGPGE